MDCENAVSPAQEMAAAATINVFRNPFSCEMNMTVDMPALGQQMQFKLVDQLGRLGQDQCL